MHFNVKHFGAHKIGATFESKTFEYSSKISIFLHLTKNFFEILTLSLLKATTQSATDYLRCYRTHHAQYGRWSHRTRQETVAALAQLA